MKTATVNVRRARTAASANAGKIMAANKRHFPCTAFLKESTVHGNFLPACMPEIIA